MNFDFTLHADSVAIAIGLLGGGWKFATAVRDEMQNMKKTIYGSKEPPVEGLVTITQRHNDWLREISGYDRRKEGKSESHTIPSRR